MRFPSAVLLALVLSIGAAPAGGTVLLVQPDGGGDLPDIASALALAISGDVVELGDGTFSGPGNRDLDLNGKAITLRSQSGDPTRCIIDAGGASGDPHRVIQFSSGETVAARLQGITLRGGYLEAGGPETAGGGILCEGASPTIENCVIEENEAWLGGGLYCWSASPVLRDCVIRGNSAGSYGGGLACESGSAPILEDCRIEDNGAGFGAGMACLASSPALTRTVLAGNTAAERGGGFYGGDGSPPLFASCTFAYNSAPVGSALSARFSCSAILDACILAFGGGEAVEVAYGSAVALSCSDIHGNAGGDWTGEIAAQLGQDGNIGADPQFCGDEASGNLYLQSDSPCADAISPCGEMGALPVLCGMTATAARSWSAVKRLY